MDSSQAFDILTPIEILSRQIIQGYTEVKTLLVVLYTYAKIILHSPTEITPPPITYYQRYTERGTKET